MWHYKQSIGRQGMDLLILVRNIFQFVYNNTRPIQADNNSQFRFSPYPNKKVYLHTVTRSITQFESIRGNFYG